MDGGGDREADCGQGTRVKRRPSSNNFFLLFKFYLITLVQKKNSLPNKLESEEVNNDAELEKSSSKQYPLNN